MSRDSTHNFYFPKNLGSKSTIIFSSRAYLFPFRLQNQEKNTIEKGKRQRIVVNDELDLTRLAVP